MHQVGTLGFKPRDHRLGIISGTVVDDQPIYRITGNDLLSDGIE
jgi:hypothetical protein